MVRVNKKYLEKELQMLAWRSFLDAVKQSKSEEEIIPIVKKFFTASEITLLEKRLVIPILLNRGLSYRKIGEIIDVSPATISFVKHNLSKKPVIHCKYGSFEKKPRTKFPSLPPRAYLPRRRKKP
ncbi:MAG: Trp family transcriptional regulator [Patescibacteria group bacterium]